MDGSMGVYYRSFNKINKFILIKLWGKVVLRVEQLYADKLVALKSLALSLSTTSPEVLIDQNRFLPDLSYIFSQYLITCFWQP